MFANSKMDSVQALERNVSLSVTDLKEPTLMRNLVILLALGSEMAFSAIASANERPNIIWIVVEDMSPHFGCYGETSIETPRIDRMAAEGVRFSNAFVTAPVCSPSRSAMITGMYQTTIGAHHHRSGRGTETIPLPEGVKLIPESLHQAGYFTSNGTIDGRPGKTDYNFDFGPSVFDGSDWSGRAEGQPFFAQIQLNGGKLREGASWGNQVVPSLDRLTDPEFVNLPPYYPRDPVILEDWAHYLDTVRFTDQQVGKILDRLDNEGLTDSTYVFFMTDHGISHARGKQFLYEEGVRIPLIVRGPGLAPGTVRDDLVVHIDMSTTSLDLAGVDVPSKMEGRALFSEDFEPRSYVVCARDRCDETVDGIRCVRTDRYKLIENRYPGRPYLQPCAYKDNKPILKALRRLYEAGTLDDAQRLHFAESRPRYELYDLQSDPWELTNLAEKPGSRDAFNQLKVWLDRWVEETGDQGRFPEPEEMYVSDMNAYVDQIRANNPERADEISRNIEVMKRWASEGK